MRRRRESFRLLSRSPSGADLLGRRRRRRKKAKAKRKERAPVPEEEDEDAHLDPEASASLPLASRSLLRADTAPVKQSVARSSRGASRRLPRSRPGRARIRSARRRTKRCAAPFSRALCLSCIR